MKKIIAVFLAALMLLSLCSCGTQSDNTPAAEAEEQSPAPEDKAAQNEAQPENQGEAAPEKTPEPEDDRPDSIENLYDYYEALVSALSDRVEGMVDEHNKKLEAQENYDPDELLQVFYLPFFDIESVDAVYFDGVASLDTVKTAYEIYEYENVSVECTGTNEYTVCYDSRADGEEAETHSYKKIFKASYDNLGFAFYFYKDDALESFFEYKSIGENRYALMDMTGRAIVSYADGAVSDLLHAENIHDVDWETNELSADSVVNIYPDESIWERSDLDEAWVTEHVPDNCVYRLYSVSGNKLTITGMNMDYNYDTGDIIYVPGYSVTVEEVNE
jgi:hypothetical protein